MYPIPGIELKVVEWGVGLQFDMLSYTLIDRRAGVAMKIVAAKL
jgi:hypothetical protein